MINKKALFQTIILWVLISVGVIFLCIFPKQILIFYLGIIPLYFLGTLIMKSYESFARDKSDYLLPNRGEIISQGKPKSERPKPKPSYHSNRIKINSEPPEGKPDRPKPVLHKSSHLEDTTIKCGRQFYPPRNTKSSIPSGWEEK